MSNSIEDVRALTRLAIEINDHYDQSEFLAAETREKGSETVKERILLGVKLIDAKSRLKYGQWMGWLAKHCPKISRQTAERAMILANCSHVSNLDTCAGLRQAYVICGILPESVPAPGEQAEQGPDMTIDRIAKRIDWFRTRLTKESVVAWSQEQKQRMAAALRPMVDLYSQLIPDAC